MKNSLILFAALVFLTACTKTNPDEQAIADAGHEEPHVENEALLEGSPLLQAEALAKSIEAGIGTESYDWFVIDTSEAFPPESLEGVPPYFNFYSRKEDGSLAIATVGIGYETWSKEFVYIFDEKGDLVQFSDRTIGRPDAPADLNNFYSSGEVIEAATTLPISEEEMEALFETKKQPTKEQLEGFFRY